MSTEKDTTVRVTRETMDELFMYKRSPSETYDDVIQRLMAETQHLKPRDESAEAAD